MEWHAFLFVTWVGVGSWSARSFDHVSPQSFQEMKLGMTREQVQRILGMPTPRVMYQWDNVRRKNFDIRCWMGESYTIAGAFDQNNRLRHKALINELEVTINLSTFDVFRLWFRRNWAQLAQ